MPPAKDAFETAAIEAAIGAAIDDTNFEIFDSAFGEQKSTEDETGDRSVEAMGEGLEGQHEVGEEIGDEGDEEAGDETGDEKGETGKEGEGKEPGEKPEVLRTEPEGRVPPGRLREATERAKTAEAERDALKSQIETSQRDMATLKTQVETLLTALKPGQQERPKTEPPTEAAKPDLFENPDAFLDAKLSPILQAIQNNRVETSMALAHNKHGPVFEKAFEAVSKLNPQNPDHQQIVRSIYASPNQGEALVAWHKRNETLAQVGDDPAAFRERIAKETRESLMKDPEFRKQLIAELRGQAEDDGTGRPNTTVRLPRSLNGREGGTSRDLVDSSMLDDSAQGIFDSAWAPR